MTTDEALNLISDISNYFHSKASILYWLKRHDESLVAYNQALTLEPKYRDIWEGKGQLLEDLGRYDEALECYYSLDSFEEIQRPKDRWAPWGISRCLRKLGRIKEADEISKNIKF